MQVFYTSADSSLSHFDGIPVVKGVIERLKDAAANPMSILTQKTDFFGRELSDSDTTLAELSKEPIDDGLFSSMVCACVTATVVVLERRYKRYFETPITDNMRTQTQSARTHNMDAEEIMGMYSAGSDKAKNATVGFLSSKMRARKNKVVPRLDDMNAESRDIVIRWSINRARKRRTITRKKDTEMKQEMARRAANKRQEKKMKRKERMWRKG